MMNKLALFRFSRQLLVPFFALLLSGIIYNARHITVDSDILAADFQEAFNEFAGKTQQELALFVEQYKASEGESIQDLGYLELLKNKYQTKGMVFLVYDKDGLFFWSHNALPLQHLQPPLHTSKISQKANGWYYCKQIQRNEKTFVVYALIKQDFKYQNVFLVNAYHHDLPKIEHQFYISERKNEGYSITDAEGQFLFSLVVRREAALVKSVDWVYVLSLVLALTALLSFVFYSFRFFSRIYFAKKQAWATGGFILTLLLLRILLFWQQIPSVFYKGALFSPGLYAASGYLPSLGDLLLNVGLTAIVAYFVYYHLRRIGVNKPNKQWTSYFIGFGLFLLIYLICGVTLHIIEGLVINSHLHLDVNFIFNLDAYSLLGFLIIGLIFFSFFFLSVVLCKTVRSFFNKQQTFWKLCAVSFGGLFFLTWLFFGVSILLWLLALAAIVVYEIDTRNETPQKNFAGLVVSLILFSLIATLALDRFNIEKDYEKRKTQALQLASEQDPVAEFLFLETEEALFNDNQLQNLIQLDPYNETAIYYYLQYHYFYDFWEKYDMQITVCKPGEILTIKPSYVEEECASFFKSYIQTFGKETISENMIYLDNNTGRNSYIVLLPVGVDESNPDPGYHVYIEFDAKFIARDMGFPDLLIDDAIDINRELINYSYAMYKNDLLVNEFGLYHYNMDVSTYIETDQEFVEFVLDGYSHLMYHKDDETVLIISRLKRSLVEAVAPFSYLFITFFVILLVFWLMVSRKKPSKLLKMNFQRRLQYAMISILIVSALTIGGAAGWFIFNIYEKKNRALINEKTHSVLLEMEHALGNEVFLDFEMDYYLYDLLLQYANVFVTDVNLYSPEGFLLATSRPKIFEEGLLGSQMNTLAFYQMKEKKRSQFVHTEQIGKLAYLSAYAPLYNRYNQKLGYLNLPYFAKESEFRNEMYYFLVAFINIYLLLLLLAVVTALAVSNYVTRPLQLIRQSLANIQLGKPNKKIQWTREDEIANLVGEYNRMIDELAVSAELLTRSERETAWREMARQVAHEIKNPLTPMKLSVQYLEKAWHEKTDDWEDRLERFSKTMVEQIDNMAIIAKEFSDFAKMPSGTNTKVDLREFIPEVLAMYTDFEKVEISQEIRQQEKPLMVLADRNQLLRIFNNLIKNAIQAYPKGETALITVRCEKSGDHCVIRIIDEGCGISADQQQEIFTPYYTTKAKGMGLGLSMVKNIIESYHGTIFFESEEGRGSTFIIMMPLAEQPSTD